MTHIKTLRELFVVKIQSLYDIESELVKALPKMAEAATDLELKDCFREHLDETRGQVARLENVFEILGEDKEAIEVDAIRGLIKDGEWVINHAKAGETLDTALIGAARAVEHYEMAKYMAAHEMAEMLGEDEVADLLSETFEEEENADEKLDEIGKQIAEGARNGENEDEE